MILAAPHSPSIFRVKVLAASVALAVHGGVVAALLIGQTPEPSGGSVIKTMTTELIIMAPPVEIQEPLSPNPHPAPDLVSSESEPLQPDVDLISDVKPEVLSEPEPQPIPQPEDSATETAAADLARKRIADEKRRDEQARQKREKQQLEQQRQKLEQKAKQAREIEQARQQQAATQAAAAEVAAEQNRQRQADSQPYLPISKKAPEYPRRALGQRVEGDCTVGYTVTPEGRVQDPEIIGACHPLFIRPSIEAAKTFRYRPRVVNGVAVAVPKVRNTFHYKIEAH